MSSPKTHLPPLTWWVHSDLPTGCRQAGLSRRPSHQGSAGLPVCFTVGDRWPFKQVHPPPTSMHKSIIRGGISTHEVSPGMLVDLPRLLVKAVLTLLLVAFLGHMLPPHEHLFLASLQNRGRSRERGPTQGII